MTPSTLRYLVTIRRGGVVAFGVVVAATAYLFDGSAAGIDAAVGLALIVQMFAASTGFRDQANRGELDPILVTSSSRTGVVLTHWVVSIAPVGFAWLALAAADLVFLRRGWPSPLMLPALAAFGWVSCATWAIGAWLGRYSGGAIWILLLFLLGGSGRVHELRDVYLAAGASHGLDLARAAAALACPFLYLADPTAASAAILLWTVGASAAAVLGTAAVLSRVDVPLRRPL